VYAPSTKGDAPTKPAAAEPGRRPNPTRAAAPKKTVIRDPFAADIFADAVTQLEHVNRTIRIEFAVLKPQTPSSAPRQLVQAARIVLPDTVAQRLCLALYDYLKKEGLDPTTLVSQGRTAQ
jgi:hypothetical protein